MCGLFKFTAQFAFDGGGTSGFGSSGLDISLPITLGISQRCTREESGGLCAKDIGDIQRQQANGFIQFL